MEKCSLCGICGALCPAIVVKHKEFTAETGKVGRLKLIWDETKCDACKVCVEACPEECITVEREVISDKIEGKGRHYPGQLLHLHSGVHGTARPKQ